MASLEKLGLTQSQALIYRTLIGEKGVTAQELSTVTGENRTTVYMILARLEELGLVTKHTGPKTVFMAESPSTLKMLLSSKQNELKQTQAQLNSVIPMLNREYIISHQKPGVVYLEGIDGLKLIYNEIVDSKKDFLILPSVESRVSKEMNDLIEYNISQQKKYNIIARTIYPLSHKKETNVTELKSNNILVRFFGNELHHQAQMLIYSNSIAISTFNGGILTTLITNEAVANTWQGYFESMWHAGLS